MKYILLSLWLLLLSVPVCLLKAQDNGYKVGDNYDYISDVKIDAVIFRGPVYVKYPYTLRGTPYAYSDDFKEGRLRYNSKEYKSVMLNLDASRDELHLRMHDTHLTIVVDKEYVSDFSYGGHDFLNVAGNRSIAGLADGYYEVLYKGDVTLLKKTVQKFSESSGVDVAAEASSLKQFVAKHYYYIVKDGVAVQIKKRGDFTKHYREKKGAIKQFIKSNGLNLLGKESEDMVFSQIMEFIDKN